MGLLIINLINLLSSNKSNNIRIFSAITIFGEPTTKRRWTLLRKEKVGYLVLSLSGILKNTKYKRNG